MGTKLETQIRELSPSVKDALYRRLIFSDELAWLRDDKKKDKVIGFEVDQNGQELSGYALIAIQRHIVIAFVSDRDESPRLILFPTLETLFDPGYGLMDLYVTRKEFHDAKFQGVATGHGMFGDMVKDLTPPNRKMDLPETIVNQMADSIEKAESDKEPEPQTVKEQPHTAYEPEIVSDDEAPYDEGPPEEFDESPNNFDEYEEPGYDDYSSYEDYQEPEEETPAVMSRSEKLKAQQFNSLNDVIDFVVLKLGVNRPLAVTLANKAMQSKVSPEYRVQLAVNIFCKLIDENRI